MVVMLLDSFRGMGAWRNSTEIQQSGHDPRSGPQIKNGSSAKDGATERLRCGIPAPMSRRLNVVRSPPLLRGGPKLSRRVRSASLFRHTTQ